MAGVEKEELIEEMGCCGTSGATLWETEQEAKEDQEVGKGGT
jgi:hypothetical protein